MISEFNQSLEIGLDGICDFFDFDAPLNPPPPITEGMDPQAESFDQLEYYPMNQAKGPPLQ